MITFKTHAQLLISLAALTLTACATITENKQSSEDLFAPIKAGPYEVVEQSPDSDWRPVSADNMLVMTVSLAGEERTVVFELLPDLASGHVANTQALVKQGIFDNTRFYRVIDGFVAQGGPMFDDDSDLPELTEGRLSIPAELTSSIDLGEQYLAFDGDDGFADETGFYKGFAVGRDISEQKSWLLHCYGVLAAGRANDPDTGGTELYIVNGPAQRYLDRNTTVFGRVLEGMDAIQALKRTQDLSGAVELKIDENVIKQIVVASQLPPGQRPQLEVMRTDSVSFKQLLAARKNRNEDWFLYQHNYIDACGVAIPVRLAD
ncbi:peptidylprolyl isomerase [Marinicella gelatinilytica]|uniref:peptidylprolyl isomerase n=1 Tax=Marinicella gelatinilytica TaxID=2996017 RepID=UPI002260A3D4|nr:peptidylprolyl isomerase [Marinicella gelatinilytica]MCX7545953.1 peptidylprolyl isomerase [Marinicella gelatinilytica]